MTRPLLSDGLAHREKQGWAIIPIPLFFIHNRRKILSTNSINASNPLSHFSQRKVFILIDKSSKLECNSRFNYLPIFRKHHETHLSTFRYQTQTYPRLPGSLQNPRRSRSIGSPSRQRPQTLGSVILDYRFGKQYRLLKTDDFSSVFAFKNRRSRDLLQVSQSADNGLNHPRLGLVVSKKTAKRAHERNYMKRVIRDWFRLNKNSLPPHDFVVRVRLAFNRQNAAEARNQLAQLMRKR